MNKPPKIAEGPGRQGWRRGWRLSAAPVGGARPAAALRAAGHIPKCLLAYCRPFDP
jgi:hypothetical protein